MCAAHQVQLFCSLIECSEWHGQSVKAHELERISAVLYVCFSLLRSLPMKIQANSLPIDFPDSIYRIRA